MPFTFAHPAAVLPLVRIFGRHPGVLSALVIGSIAPDLGYFIPALIARNESHSIGGLFLFCLPMGLVVYIIYHKLLKGPLISIAPHFLLKKLGKYEIERNFLPAASLSSIATCLLVGAITHLVWDAFTHAGAPGVQMLAILQMVAFHIGGYPVYGYKILQHGSTVLGFTIILFYVLKWFRHERGEPVDPRYLLTNHQRDVVLAGLVILPTIISIIVGASRVGNSDFLFEFYMFAGHAVFAALPALAVSLLVYSFWWHFGRWRDRNDR